MRMLDYPAPLASAGSLVDRKSGRLHGPAVAHEAWVRARRGRSRGWRFYFVSAAAAGAATVIEKAGSVTERVPSLTVMRMFE